MGTVTLQTVISQAAKKGKKSKKVTVVLARGSLSIVGGSSKAITLHLSSQGRSLLSHAHVLHATALLAAHDSAGVTRKTLSGVTLRLVRKH